MIKILKKRNPIDTLFSNTINEPVYFQIRNRRKIINSAGLMINLINYYLNYYKSYFLHRIILNFLSYFTCIIE